MKNQQGDLILKGNLSYNLRGIKAVYPFLFYWGFF